MYRDTLEAPLKQLGLGPNNFHALRVLPLLYVAWANQHLDELEREQILSTARNRLELNSEAMQLVHHWLEAPPSEDLIRSGVACLKRAAAAPDQPDFGTDELLHILWDAETMTRRAALQTGVPYQPSQSQHDALLELAELMGLDSGTPWLSMLMELGGKSEVEQTLSAESERERPAPSSSTRQDRLRRWRTAYRLHTSHNHRVAPPGGLI